MFSAKRAWLTPQAGCRRRGCDFVRYENLIHDYGLLNAISQVPAVRDALHQSRGNAEEAPEMTQSIANCR